MSKEKVWCCTKNNFLSKQKAWCCTKVDAAQKSVSCRQKQDVVTNDDVKTM